MKICLVLKTFFFFKNFRKENYKIYIVFIGDGVSHIILLEGGLGCGKSLIEKYIKYILPPLTLKEMIESVKLQAL
ncbi:ATP-binding protein, partial [Helicobacter muridarum]|uniref:ATP-binding protein n=1 Tax=Helicobacter muridarum TaxID=216 RepID=UPI001F399A1A